MLTGWYPAFKLDRPLEPEEKYAHLPYETAQSFTPDDAVGMTRFNSTFMEFVNRTFKVKGMSPTLGSGLISIAFISLFVFLAYESIFENNGSWGETLIYLLMLSSSLVGGAVFFWWIHLRKDLFAYTHYPVRFNRKTRQVHFFVHNGPGGVVTVPWGDPDVFFHIGHGTRDKDLRDLRCHLLKNGQVIRTFTIGHYWRHENHVREEWELIRRYMEEGPEKAFDNEQDRVITLSPRGSWLNCYMSVCQALGTDLYAIRYVLFPIYGLLTLSRWLTFKSCRAPVWPPEVEASCAIEPNDPYLLPEPESMAEFTDEAGYQRSAERHQQRQGWK